MNSSFSLSETDLLGLVRQEGLMVIDSISIKARRQIDPNREILECDLIGRHSNYGSAIFDFKHGLPLTDQILDVTYANIPAVSSRSSCLPVPLCPLIPKCRRQTSGL